MRHREFITFRIASVLLNPSSKLGLLAGVLFIQTNTQKLISAYFNARFVYIFLKRA